MKSLPCLALAILVASVAGCRAHEEPTTQEPATIRQIGQADPQTGAIPRSMGTSESNP